MTNETNNRRQEIENRLNQQIGNFSTHGNIGSPRFEVESTENGFKAYIGNRGIAIKNAAEKVGKEFGYRVEFNKEESDSFSSTYNFINE